MPLFLREHQLGSCNVSFLNHNRECELCSLPYYNLLPPHSTRERFGGLAQSEYEKKTCGTICETDSLSGLCNGLGVPTWVWPWTPSQGAIPKCNVFSGTSFQERGVECEESTQSTFPTQVDFCSSDCTRTCNQNPSSRAAQ